MKHIMPDYAECDNCHATTRKGGDFLHKLIEEAGFKGYRVGGILFVDLCPRCQNRMTVKELNRLAEEIQQKRRETPLLT